jgi:hypothetical protein
MHGGRGLHCKIAGAASEHTFEPRNFDFGGKGSLATEADCLDSKFLSDTNSELDRNMKVKERVHVKKAWDN